MEYFILFLAVLYAMLSAYIVWKGEEYRRASKKRMARWHDATIKLLDNLSELNDFERSLRNDGLTNNSKKKR